MWSWLTSCVQRQHLHILRAQRSHRSFTYSMYKHTNVIKENIFYTYHTNHMDLQIRHKKQSSRNKKYNHIFKTVQSSRRKKIQQYILNRSHCKIQSKHNKNVNNHMYVAFFQKPCKLTQTSGKTLQTVKFARKNN